MNVLDRIVGPLVRDPFDLGRAIVVEVWHHPFIYGVVVALLPALALWGCFCLRFAPEDAMSKGEVLAVHTLRAAGR